MSQSLSRVLFLIHSVPACGTARPDFFVSVLASPCPGCPSSFGSAVSLARLRCCLWNLTLRSNSSFPQRVTSFTLDHMKKLKNNPIVGDIGFCGQRVRPSWLRLLGMHDSSTHLGTCSFYCYWSRRDRAGFRPTAQLGLRHSLRPFLMSCFFAVQVLTQLDLLRYWKEIATNKNEVYFLPNRLVEKMAITPPCVSCRSSREFRGP